MLSLYLGKLLSFPSVYLVLIWAFTRHSDATGERFYHIAGPLVFGIVGFIIAISTMNTAARYISLYVYTIFPPLDLSLTMCSFLMAQSYSGFVVFYAWISNTIPRPPAKRAVALALINAFSQLGNIAGSYVWPTMWGPTYRHSYAICIATNGLSIVMCYIFRLHLLSLNKKLEEREREMGQTKKGFRYLA